MAEEKQGEGIMRGGRPGAHVGSWSWRALVKRCHSRCGAEQSLVCSETVYRDLWSEAGDRTGPYSIKSQEMMVSQVRVA